MKRLNEVFTDEQHEELVGVKGERTWHNAILEEFGVENDE